MTSTPAYVPNSEQLQLCLLALCVRRSVVSKIDSRTGMGSSEAQPELPCEDAGAPSVPFIPVGAVSARKALSSLHFEREGERKKVVVGSDSIVSWFCCPPMQPLLSYENDDKSHSKTWHWTNYIGRGCFSVNADAEEPHFLLPGQAHWPELPAAPCPLPTAHCCNAGRNLKRQRQSDGAGCMRFQYVCTGKRSIPHATQTARPASHITYRLQDAKNAPGLDWGVRTDNCRVGFVSLLWR